MVPVLPVVVRDNEAKSGPSFPVSFGKTRRRVVPVSPTFFPFSDSFCPFLPVLSSFMLPRSFLDRTAPYSKPGLNPSKLSER